MTLFRISNSKTWNVSIVMNNELEKAVKYFFPNLVCIPECTVSNVVLEKVGEGHVQRLCQEVLQSVVEE